MQLQIDMANSSKGRVFRAEMVAYSRFKRAEDEPKNWRPVWAMFAGTETQLRPFVANLSTGRSASETSRHGATVEFLKSKGFKTLWQRSPSGMTATIYRQDLFLVDPGMVDNTMIQFVIVPTKEFLHPDDEVAQYLKDGIGDAIIKAANRYEMNLDCDYIASLAPSFCAFLDRRCFLPIIPDHKFYARLLTACISKGLASFGSKNNYSRGRSWGHTFGEEEGFSSINVSPPLYVHMTQDLLAQVMAEQVEQYVSGNHVIDAGFYAGSY